MSIPWSISPVFPGLPKADCVGHQASSGPTALQHPSCKLDFASCLPASSDANHHLLPSFYSPTNLKLSFLSCAWTYSSSQYLNPTAVFKLNDSQLDLQQQDIHWWRTTLTICREEGSDGAFELSPFSIIPWHPVIHLPPAPASAHHNGTQLTALGRAFRHSLSSDSSRPCPDIPRNV